MRSMWRRPTWWQSLAAAFAVGVLVAAAIVLIVDAGGDGDDAPETAAERPAASVELTYRPDDGGQRATIACEGRETARATGAWQADPGAACDALYAAAPTLLAEPPDEPQACAEVFYGPEAVRVSGRIGDEQVDRTFTRQDACAEERWQAVRVLADPWLARERPEADEPATTAG